MAVASIVAYARPRTPRMPAPRPTRQQQLEQDARDLARLGYAQQLFREMGGFSNFAISFSIISVLTGAVLLYGSGLKLAGPVINTLGWPVASLFTLCVAASMAELASAYPTAGGLYFWAFRLGGRGWAWLTAWLNMIGQVTITVGINVAAATYLIGAVTRIAGLPADVAVPVFGTATSWYFQLTVMIVIMIPQVLINVYGIRLTARLSDFSVWWHVGGVLMIVLALALLGAHHNDARFLVRHVTIASPLEASSADLGGGRTAPALVVADYKIPSPLFALAPGLLALYGAVPPALGHVIAVIIGVAMWLCGLASITSMGRMWYAFARDDGMPGARFLKRVHPALRTPVWSIVATSTLAVLITVYAAAYSAVTSISTITLYLAYVIPIWLNWLNRLRRRGEYATRVTAPWSLGRFGPAINAVAILWVIVISVVFALPPNELVLWTILLLGGLIALYWTLSARHRFVGPAAARR